MESQNEEREDMTEQMKYARLKENLGRLGLQGMEINLDDYLEQIEKNEKTVIGALCELTDIEVRLKGERAIRGCVAVANFPFLKEMNDFDFSFQPSIQKEQLDGLLSLRFLEKKQNVLFIGSPGVGKTHLSVAIGIEAAKNRKSTYFVNCNDLLQNLKKAKAENRLEKRLKFYSRYKLLIIDEVGFLPIDKEDSKLFFQLIAKRYEKQSTIITSNIELSQWDEIFGDPVLANAVLDRLLHHCEVIKIIGESYRTKDMLRLLGEE